MFENMESGTQQCVVLDLPPNITLFIQGKKMNCFATFVAVLL
jgi:hypothetical protein